MNEKKAIDDQELDKAAGGTGGDGFEQAWAAYAATHCRDCGVLGDVSGGRGMVCQGEKQLAAAAWAAGQPIRCRAYIAPC